MKLVLGDGFVAAGFHLGGTKIVDGGWGNYQTTGVNGDVAGAALNHFGGGKDLFSIRIGFVEFLSSG